MSDEIAGAIVVENKNMASEMRLVVVAELKLKAKAPEKKTLVERRQID